MHASIPAWVPLVFLLLLAMGWRQSRTRVVRPATLRIVALAMAAFSLYGIVGAFGVTPVALVPWLTAYGLSAFGGARLVGTGGMAREGDAVRVPGSWTPMALMMGIFAAKFFLGFATGVGASFLHEGVFVGAMGGVLGLLSGGFGARAVALHRYANAGTEAVPA